MIPQMIFYFFSVGPAQQQETEFTAKIIRRSRQLLTFG
jgi:hypothetical protein